MELSIKWTTATVVAVCLVLALSGGSVTGQSTPIQASETPTPSTTVTEQQSVTENQRAVNTSTKTASVSDGQTSTARITSTPTERKNATSTPSDPRSDQVAELESTSGTIVVDQDGTTGYSTIQAGIDEASDGDTVVVRPGTYTTNRTVANVSKNLTIRAPAGATIRLHLYDAGMTYPRGETGFAIRSEDPVSVTIQGFNFESRYQTYTRYSPTAIDADQLNGTLTLRDVNAVEATGIGISTRPGSKVRVKTSSLDGFGVDLNDSTLTVANSEIEDANVDGEGAAEIDNVTAIDSNTGSDWWLGTSVNSTVRDSSLLITPNELTAAVRIQNSDVTIEAPRRFERANWTLDSVTGSITVPYSEGNWTLQNVTLDGGIDASGAEGNWTIRDSRIDASDSDPMIDASDSSGDWTLRNVVLEDDDASVAVDASESSGDWYVDRTVLRPGDATSDSAAILASGAGGNWRITNSHLSDGNTGIAARESNGNWHVSNVLVGNSTVGIGATDASGQWTIEGSAVLANDEGGIRADGVTGNWSVHESDLSDNGEYSLNASDAESTIDATRNWWGASDGPSGLFGGSGSSVAGPASVRPFYTDAELETLVSTSDDDVVVSSNSPQNVTASNPVLGGSLSLGRNATATVYVVYWEAGARNATETWWTGPSYSNSTDFSTTVDVRAGTKYEATTYAKTANETWKRGGTVTFRTPGRSHAVKTLSAQSGANGTTTLQGNLTSLGDAPSATPYFEYWSVENPNETYWWTGDQRFVPEDFSAQVDLAPGTTYRYRALSQDANDDWRTGAVRNVTTPPTSDVRATTLAPSNVTEGNATLHGNVTGLQSQSARTYFAYWEAGQENDTKTWWTGENETGDRSFDATVDLEAGTEYRVRALAETANGEWKDGDVRNFSTPGQHFAVTTGSLTQHTHTNGTDTFDLHGNLTGLGNEPNATVYVRYWEQGNRSETLTWWTGPQRTEPGRFEASVGAVPDNEDYVYQALAKGASGTWRSGETRPLVFETEFA